MAPLIKHYYCTPFLYVHLSVTIVSFCCCIFLLFVQKMKQVGVLLPLNYVLLFFCVDFFCFFFFCRRSCGRLPTFFFCICFVEWTEKPTNHPTFSSIDQLHIMHMNLQLQHHRVEWLTNQSTTSTVQYYYTIIYFFSFFVLGV